MDDISIIESTNQSIVFPDAPQCQNGSPIEALILQFVKDKAARSQSLKTAKAYFDTVTMFRTYLREHGYDLIMYIREEAGWNDYTFIRSKIADCASDFVIRSKKPGKTLVAEATRDQRLAILSSFYQYADTRRKVPFSNPIMMIERSPIEAYAGAVALSEDHVQAVLAKIDRSTLIGQRNYTLLLVLFTTGGRVGQVQLLTRGALYVSPSRVVTIVFRHMKGNKASEQQLDPRVSVCLLEYIETLYGRPIEQIEASAPLWTILNDIPSPVKANGAVLYQKGSPLGYGLSATYASSFWGLARFIRPGIPLALPCWKLERRMMNFRSSSTIATRKRRNATRATLSGRRISMQRPLLHDLGCNA